jgi:hypothetical protein
MNAPDPLEQARGALLEHVRAALHRYARRVSVRVAGVKEAAAIERILRDEMAGTLEELHLDNAGMARLRLRWALASALAELERLTSGGGANS